MAGEPPPPHLPWRARKKEPEKPAPAPPPTIIEKTIVEKPIYIIRPTGPMLTPPTHDRLHSLQSLLDHPDIDITPPTAGQALTWDELLGKWKAKTLVGMAVHGNEYHEPDFSEITHTHAQLHNRLHDHSLAEDGSPIALAGVPDLPASKITSGLFDAGRIPWQLINSDILPVTSDPLLHIGAIDKVWGYAYITGAYILGAPGEDPSAYLGPGGIEFGSGEGAMDVNLYRLDADTLKTDDVFEAAGIVAPNIDAATLEGQTKTEVQDHTPKAHETSHLSGQSDPLPWGAGGELDADKVDGLHASEIGGGALSHQQAIGSTNASTTSTSYVDVDQMTLTVAEAGTYLIMYSMNFRCQDSAEATLRYIQGRILINTSVFINAVMHKWYTSPEIDIYGAFSCLGIADLAVGDVVKFQWCVQNSNVTLSNTIATNPTLFYRRLVIIKIA